MASWPKAPFDATQLKAEPNDPYKTTNCNVMLRMIKIYYICLPFSLCNIYAFKMSLSLSEVYFRSNSYRSMGFVKRAGWYQTSQSCTPKYSPHYHILNHIYCENYRWWKWNHTYHRILFGTMQTNSQKAREWLTLTYIAVLGSSQCPQLLIYLLKTGSSASHRASHNTRCLKRKTAKQHKICITVTDN